MVAYDATNNSHVGVLIKWWHDLPDKDRADLFYPLLHKLGPFLHFFETAGLIFAIDNLGITVAAWTEPTFDGALFSLWVRPDLRFSRSAWQEVEQAYTLAFKVYPTLIGQTRQPKLHVTHLKLGYSYSGCLKHIFKGGPVYFYELTKEAWEARRETARTIRQNKRAKREMQVQNRNGAAASMEQ
jgi:hypothetical protein